MAILLAALTFLVPLAIFLAIAWAGREKINADDISRRLALIEAGQKQSAYAADLKLVRDEKLSSMPFLHNLLNRWSVAELMSNLMAQAGVKAKPGKLVLWCAVAGLIVYLFLSEITDSLLLGLLLGLIASLVPLVVVAVKRHRRLRDFETHFPEAIDLLTRAMRAGHSFTTGMEMVGREIAEPLGGEFRTVFEEQNLGLSVREAMLHLVNRVPLVDVRFFVTALLIQKETGGNLAEILENLARVIRDRFRLRGEIRVRTAQGRLTAAILMALPPAMLFVMRMINPSYADLLFTDPWGPYMLGSAICLQAIGSLILWRIVNLEV
ncbi:MAG: type II secretion system F family protein [Candidatus Acidiferrales bacterium]